MQEHYNKVYSKSYFGNKLMPDDKTFTVKQTRPLMNDLTKFMVDNHVDYILEFGSGMGYNVFNLRERGFKAWGVDFCDPFIERSLKKYGPYYTVLDLEKPIEEGKGQFNLIYGFDFIEHIFNYHQVLDNAKYLLAEKGYLVLSTPNVTSLRNRWQTLIGDDKTYKSFEHIRFFSIPYLISILELHDFEVIKVKTYGRLSFIKPLSGTFVIYAQKKQGG